MRNQLFKFSRALFVCLICFLSASCEKAVFDDGEDGGKPVAKTNSTLSFNTRAGNDTGDEETKVSYPVYIYVFDTKQNCVGLQKVNSETDGIGMKLAAGNYTVCAVAVGDGDRYEMPAVETVTAESSVALKSGMTHGDLMTAKANVAMGENEANQLNLVLQRQVMMLDNVTFTNIPTDVKNVALTVSPLYEDVTVGGDCTGVNGSQTVTLKRTGDTQTWQNTEKVYLLASTDKATLKVSLTDGDGKISSFSYVCEESLDANQKINVTGRYVSNSFAMSGTIKGASWQTVKNISFDLKEKASDAGSGIAGTAPAVGSVYKNHLVVKSETQGASTIVTLMSLTETTALTYTDNDQASAGEAVAKALDEMKDQGIALRLPTLDEWTYVRTNAADINAKLAAAGKQQITIDTGKANTNGYYFQKDDKTVSLYFLNDGVEGVSLKSGKSNYRLRGFATLTFVAS